MKRIFDKFESHKLMHKLHQLQKKLKRAVDNNYPKEKIEERIRRIKKIQVSLKKSRK
jgi:hypothetical protein